MRVQTGALIKLRFFVARKPQASLWWLISDELSGHHIILEVAGQKIPIVSTFVGISIAGANVGDRLELPPLHGDARDVVEALEIEEIL